MLLAARRGDTKVVSLLIEAGANTAATDMEQWSALHWAANNGHIDTVSVILASGVDTECRNADG